MIIKNKTVEELRRYYSRLFNSNKDQKRKVAHILGKIRKLEANK